MYICSVYVYLSSVYMYISIHVYMYVLMYVHMYIPTDIYIYICYPPPLRSMDFRLLGKGRLRVFSNYLIQKSWQHENSLNWLLV